MKLQTLLRRLAAGALCTASLPALAVDGVKLIDQARAMAGNVTPGDAPGFPVTITEPGSYRLSTNLVVPDTETTAVHILAPNVTLDLNGFAIIGPVSCSYGAAPANRTCSGQSSNFGVGDGVRFGGDNAGWVNTFAAGTVRNGVIRGMGGFGVYMPNGYAGLRADDLTLVNNGRGGLWGNAVVMTRSLMLANGGIGASGNGVHVVHSQATENTSYGLAGIGSRGDNLLRGNNGGGTNAEVASGSKATTPSLCGQVVCP